MPQKSKSVVKLPTDFSEFHRQEVARRMREEQENISEPRKEKEQEPPRPRQLSPEEIALWKLLGDDDENVEEEEVVEEEKPLDVEETKMLCREYINKRIRILQNGDEDYLNRAEIESLPAYDKMRVEFTGSYVWTPQQLDPGVLNFLQRRMEDCPYAETAIGYQTLLEMYTSILGPDFYFLSLCQSDPRFYLYERWALFGY